MNTAPLQLPVPVLEHPHWRVNIRPGQYQPDAIPSLQRCIELVERNCVRLRGWDYPHLSHRHEERAYGNDWIASWSSFMGHCEYWRLYQSAQFIHVFSVREATEPDWREKLQAETASHLRQLRDIDWSSVPGFLSLINFTYCVTEIVEFATRMAQAGVYQGQLELTIRLKGIRGFVLTTSWERAWLNYYAASEDLIGNTWHVNSDSLLSESAQWVLDLLLWFFERFGWLNPSPEVLRSDISDFRNRLR